MPAWDKSPLAAAGWPYVLGYLVLALTATALGVWILAVPLWLLWGIITYFFRDPARQSSAGPGAVISPADGKVVAVRQVACPWLPGGQGRMISIFMSIFDVHVNRAPISGKVIHISHYDGSFVPADRDQAWEVNHRVAMLMEAPDGTPLVVTQVAGLVARHIINRLVPGDEVQRSSRYGMIRFGSRLDVVLPLTASASVVPGQRVRAGETQIGEL